MKILLDTHAFLWWLDDPMSLSTQANDAIADQSNEVYVSSVIVWEMMIKVAIGKLKIPSDLDAALTHERFIHLPITIAHARATAALPSIHKDPFDRMLIAQALHEGFHLATRDIFIAQYAVDILPA
jgi:PIN domain nuclease of toxin-antitoxin system